MISDAGDPPAPSGSRIDLTQVQSLRRRLWWHFGVGFAKMVMACGSRVRVRGWEHIPREGPLLLASNHISHFDPPLISAHFPRPVDWLAMSELYALGWSERLFLSLNAIPVRRGSPDRTALREAGNRLQAGRTVGIFPEGGLRDGEASLLAGAPPRRGAGLLARLTKAPVLPCAILGSDRLYNWHRWRPWSRAPVWILFGKVLPECRDDASFAENLTSAFAELRTLALSQGATPADFPSPPRERMKEP